MTTTSEVSNLHLGDCFNECAECDAYVNVLPRHAECHSECECVTYAAAEAGAARRHPVIAEHPGFTDYMVHAHITEQHPDIAIIRNAYVAGWVDCRAASFITTSVATPSVTTAATSW